MVQKVCQLSKVYTVQDFMAYTVSQKLLIEVNSIRNARLYTPNYAQFFSSNYPIFPKMFNLRGEDLGV